MRDAHDQGRALLQSDVVDLVLLAGDDAAEAHDRRLRHLADHSRHDVQRRRPRAVQRGEVLTAVDVGR
jgi:hypothetical protein